MHTQLLTTKLYIPPARPNLVPRPRLLERLDEGLRLSRKLTLVSAPAGFGKTTLLSDWIHRMAATLAAPAPPRVAWLSLDEGDNDPVYFLSYLVAALQTVHEDVGRAVPGALRSPQPPPIESILVGLINDLAALPPERRFILVIDDYHVIDAPAIHDALGFLLEHQPPHMDLVISTRKDPPLPLARLRARGQTTEIRAADLQFTQEEATAFFNHVLNLGLGPEQVEALAVRTEGWVAGLQLAALSLEGEADPAGFIRTFAGDDRHVMDYLVDEVLSRQPPPVREFLLTTSILRRLSGPLCDAVLQIGEPANERMSESANEQAVDTLTRPFADAQAVLEHLERSNLFVVPLDNKRQWYRYHHLFAELLRYRLGREHPGRISELHRRAGAWYAAHGQRSEAIRHALAAGDVDRAAELIAAAVPEVFRNSELTTLLGWLNALPESLVQQRPFLSMAMAWAKVALGQSDGVDRHLQDVERHIGLRADGSPASLQADAELRGVLAEISCIRTSLAFNRMDPDAAMPLAEQTTAYLGDDVKRELLNMGQPLRELATFNLALAHQFKGETVQAIEAFEAAIRLLREEDRNLDLLAHHMDHLAELQIALGQLHRAAHTYEEALAVAERGGTPSSLAGIAYTGRGTLLYEWNRLDEAADALNLGLEMVQSWFYWDTMLAATTGLACIDLAQGRPPQATARLEALVEMARERGMQWALPRAEAHLALCRARQGDLAAAGRWLETDALHLDGEVSFEQRPYAMLRIWVLLLVGRAEAAHRRAERIVEHAEASQHWGYAVEGWVLQAFASDALGDRAAAVQSLERALRLAEPGGYVRTFVDAGPTLAELLSELDVLPAYVDRLLDAFGRAVPPSGPQVERPAAEPNKARASQLVEPLTDRELEVLAAVAEGLTNQQIADRLYVSVNTVKTHVKHIYQKLNVRNRAQATSRASHLDLL